MITAIFTRARPLWLLFATTLLIAGCSGGGPGGKNGTAVSYTIVEKVADAPYDQVVAGIEAGVKGSNLMIIGEPNYKAMQRMVGRQIRDAKSFFVFRPDLGTQVFENDYNAAAEIPLKILIYDRGDGKTVVRYRKPSSQLANYKNLSGLGDRLDEILANIVNAGIGATGDASAKEVRMTHEVVEKVFAASYDQAVAKIEAAVKGSGLMIIGEPNYKSMQRMVGRQIRDAKKYFVFRPDLGTQVFENDYNAALELPMEILIYDRGDGKTVVRYRKPSVALGNYSGLGGLGKTLDGVIERIVGAAQTSS